MCNVCLNKTHFKTQARVVLRFSDDHDSEYKEQNSNSAAFMIITVIVTAEHWVTPKKYIYIIYNNHLLAWVSFSLIRLLTS
jgi:hypothetical protein